MDEISNSPTLPTQEHELPSLSNLIDYSQTNGSIEQSDDEYVDPYDIQTELYESLQRNTELLKQVQTTVMRMNSDISSVNQRMLDLEQTINNLKQSTVQNNSLNILERKHNYPKWWPFSDISPSWFILLIVWPFIVRRVGKILANPTKRK